MSNNFITTNKDLCNKIEHYLPQAKTNIFYLYEELVTKYMNSKRNQIIVDVGSGASCPFVKYKNPNLGTKIIAVDVSLELMKNNHDVDEKRIANIIENFPFENEEVDIITSRSVLEHLEDLERFIINSKRVLKINGYFIHLFPSKFAPFALFNQLLPKKVVNSLLYLVNPKYKGILGFPAFYDRCFYSGIKMLLEKNNFKIIDLHFGYYQSRYYNFFVIFFLFSALYEILIQASKIKNLCAYLLIIAQKK